MRDKQLVFKVKQFMEDGLCGRLLSEINTDIALKIVNSQPLEVRERENLYMLTQALKCLEEKLQEYVNIYDENNQE